MPTHPKTKPAQPIKADRKQKTQPRHAWQPTTIGTQVKAGLKERLQKYFDEFLETGRAQEVGFLVEVFNERESVGGEYFPGEPHDYEAPLFSAIESAIKKSTRPVVVLPCQEMLRPVNDFIEELDKAAEKDTKILARKFLSTSEIRARREVDLKSLIDMFNAKTTNDDLYFLYMVLARWAGILEFNPEDQPESPIMSALQYELDHQHWVVNIPAATGRTATFRTLIALAKDPGWLGDFLAWVAEHHEGLSPCEVGKEAFRHQQAFDKAASTAA